MANQNHWGKNNVNKSTATTRKISHRIAEPMPYPLPFQHEYEIKEFKQVDGTWELCVFIEDVQIEHKIRVHGDLNVGGAMHQLVESVAIEKNWSDHAFWWPEKKKWLTKNRTTLNQYGLHANVQLQFRRIHNDLTIQLPDLHDITLRVNCSKPVFAVVAQLCKELGIRHSEELSLLFVSELNVSRFNRPSLRRSQSERLSVRASAPPTPQSPRSPNFPQTPYSPRTPNSPSSNGNQSTLNDSPVIQDILNSAHANSTYISSHVAFNERGLQQFKNLTHKALVNIAWLDSSRSLMEQTMEPYAKRMCLRFKYHSYYDLDAKYDSIRINQLYEQARWSIIAEEVDCTEEEALLLAALQLHVNVQMRQPQSSQEYEGVGDDEIDAALTELEQNLKSTDISDKLFSPDFHPTNNNTSPTVIFQVPKLTGTLKFFKPKRHGLKHYKDKFCVLQDTTLAVFKEENSAQNDAPSEIFNLKNVEVITNVKLSTEKLGMKLFVQTKSGIQELWLKCSSREQYANWLAACKLISRGKTMASRVQYDNEIRAIVNHLELQAPNVQKQHNSYATPEILPNDYVPSRFVKKYKHHQSVSAKILERFSNIQCNNLLDAKLEYIKAWQRLSAYGITYFIGRFNQHKQEELLGIAVNRVMRLDRHNGEVLNTWRYTEMRCWTANWETNQVVMEFNHESMTFQPSFTSCKTVHEFIGGYVFLNMRTPEKSQQLNEDLFYKLTCSNME